ncbi:unnamed protein product, partial [Rotaria sordida]
LADKPIQKETIESKRTGSIDLNVYIRYIRASGCGILGLLCLFLMFAVTSTTFLLVNWWLGRWSNSERIRYGSTNIMSNCSSMEQSPITNMSNEE